MGTALAKQNFQQMLKSWKAIAPIVHEPQNSDDYEKLSHLLDKLLDLVGEDESHELIGLVDVISHMIAMHDEYQGYHVDSLSGIDALKFLMQQHNLKQADLSDIGSQGVVSEILNGKRSLNISQIRKLSKRFNVSNSTFIDD